MVDKTAYIETSELSPYHNLALEEYLMDHCEADQCILYLWQNQHTVVIGRNQNAWKECLVSHLEEENGHLARRLSGGGAVYHDLGNLNFTFLVNKKNYNLDRQLEVIIRAADKLGIRAEKSGRNDILVDGRKFSGNAFHQQNQRCYHHGTIMVDVNIGELSKYLTVSKDKLKSKGIDSVKSRVVNLKEFCSDLTITQLKAALLEAFQDVYNRKAEIVKEADLDSVEIQQLTEKYASREWKYGRNLPFQYERSERFAWGTVTFQFQIDHGILKNTTIYSDAMNADIIQRISSSLKDIPYEKQAFIKVLNKLTANENQEQVILNNLTTWFAAMDL